ncbi:TetR/AcrR family transcriptional regulator [Sporosarcina sp. FSL K6-3457]|uniref:TetR/AcrR family transcriptional regulator n=1 Tax=Sporosarcina sp. FSL K6-3457 TaxID=2978204 RepID=UPI0030F84E7A
MAPKTKFTKEIIINAAFDIAKVEGINQITARKVAEKMGSSIAPIYVNFTEIEELKMAVIQQIHMISQQMLMTKYTEDPFLNIGIASLKFSRDYPVLFKDLITNNTKYMTDVQPPGDTILQQMKQAPTLTSFTDEEMGSILFKMKVFQMGLSVMDVNGLLPVPFDEQQLIELLESTGNDLILAAQSRHNEEEQK